MKKNKKILVDMTCSLIHHGHIRILKKAYNYGKVIVALTKDKEVLKYKKFKSPPNLILVDGILPIRLWSGEQKTQIRGESHFASIAAASVLAKETRDDLMKRLSQKYNLYEIEKNKGYGTENHRKNLIKAGLTKLHRKTFLSRLEIT